MSSTRPVKFFSAQLFPGLYCSKAGFHPRCGIWHLLTLLNFIKLLLALLSIPSSSLKCGSAFKYFDWFLQFGIICKLRGSLPSSPPDYCQRYSLTGVRTYPCGTQFKQTYYMFIENISIWYIQTLSIEQADGISRHKTTSIAAYLNLIFNLVIEISCCYLHDLTLALSLVTTAFLFSQQRDKKSVQAGDQLVGQQL